MKENVAEIEMLDLGAEEWEEIEKCQTANRYDFPAVSIGKNVIYFNSKTIPFTKDAKCVKYKMSTDYILIEFLRTTADKAAFALYWDKNKGETYGLRSVFPANMKCRAVREGTYKLYRSGNRFAIKRWESLED